MFLIVWRKIDKRLNQFALGTKNEKARVRLLSLALLSNSELPLLTLGSFHPFTLISS